MHQQSQIPMLWGPKVLSGEGSSLGAKVKNVAWASGRGLRLLEFALLNGLRMDQDARILSP